MNSDNFLLFTIIALIINWIVIYQIIASASKSNKIYLEEFKQTRILHAIAKQQGVDEITLGNISKIKNEYFITQMLAKENHDEWYKSLSEEKRIKYDAKHAKAKTA